MVLVTALIGWLSGALAVQYLLTWLNDAPQLARCPLCRRPTNTAIFIGLTLGLVPKRCCRIKPPSWVSYLPPFLSIAFGCLPWLLTPLTWWNILQIGLLLFSLTCLSIMDYYRMELSARLICLTIAVRMLIVALFTPELIIDATLGLLIGSGIFPLINMAYYSLRNKDGLGEGDALLLATLGCYLGWMGLLPVLCLASIIALLVKIPQSISNPRLLNQHFPFAPYLSLAGALILFSVLLNLWPQHTLPLLLPL